MKDIKIGFTMILLFSIVILGGTILKYKVWILWETGFALSMPVKPLPPLDVELVPQILSPKVGDIIPVHLLITPKIKVHRLIVKFEAEGVVDLFIDNMSMELGEIEKDTERKIPITIRIVSEGRGRLQANVFSLGTVGGGAFGRKSSLYFLSGLEDVLIGKDGFVNLEVERLKKSYGGRFPEPDTPQYEVYKRELEKILGGGAIETNK